MNEIVNKFLLAGDKSMLEINLRLSGFICSACGLFTKKKRKNTKIQINRRFTIYLSKQTR